MDTTYVPNPLAADGRSPGNADTAGGSEGDVKTATAENPASLLIAAEASRRGLTVRNSLNSADDLYVGFTAGVNASNGFPLQAGESLPLDTTAAVYGFSVSGTAQAILIATYN